MKTKPRTIAVLTALLLAALFTAAFFYFSTRTTLLSLPPPTYFGNTVPVATWHIPEKSRFWVATGITNNASVLRLTNGVWSAGESGIRKIQWNHGIGFTLVSHVPDHPWKVELRSSGAWKLVLGPFFINLPPTERVWRSEVLPSRSQLDNAPRPPLPTEFE